MLHARRPFHSAALLLAFSAACSVEPLDAPQPAEDAPRLAEQPADDDLAGVRPPFVVQWSFEGLAGNLGELELPLTLRNAWDVELEAEVVAWVRVPGIEEDNEIEIPLLAGSFDPHETYELSLPTEALPPLTPGLPVEVRVATRGDNPQDEGSLMASTAPRLVEIDAGLDKVAVSPRPRYETIADALYDASRPVFAEQYAEGALELPIAAEPRTSAQLTTDVRICADWRVGYVDNEGETLLNVLRHQRVPASFARLVVAQPSPLLQPWLTGAIEADTVLDENGCTQVLPLTYGPHVMAVYSELNRDGLRINVEWNDEPSGMEVYDPSWSGAAFRVSGPGEIRRLTGNNDPVTRVAAVLSRALLEPDLPLAVPEDPLRFFADETCPNTGSTACASSSGVHIGTKPMTATTEEIDGTTFRNLVAHEFGHVVQFRGSQRFALDLSPGYDAELPLNCSCQHIGFGVEEPSHCLQSVERTSFALSEGFAHFVATRLFNINPFGCEFQYYKPLRRSATDIAPAPVTVRCDIPPLWEATNGCVRPGDDVEYDWLAFFWAINHAPAEQRWSVAEMFEVLDTDCAPEDRNVYRHCEVDWAWLESAVNDSSLSAAKKDRFLDTALVYGLAE